MSFVRPELHKQLTRWREVILLAALGAFGLWVAFQTNGIILRGFGYVLIALALAALLPAYRRARFHSDGQGPGVVKVDEAQIAYLGPVTGGAMALSELDQLSVRRDRKGQVAWVLANARELIVIPVNALGAEALFDAFAALPGINLDRVLAALKNPTPGSQKLWQRDAASGLTALPPRATSADLS